MPKTINHKHSFNQFSGNHVTTMMPMTPSLLSPEQTQKHNNRDLSPPLPCQNVAALNATWRTVTKAGADGGVEWVLQGRAKALVAIARVRSG